MPSLSKEEEYRIAFQGFELRLATKRGALFQEDCLRFLASIKDDSIQCIFADPPFNLGKDYGSKKIVDNLDMAAYFEWTRKWLAECVRVLKPGGSMFVYHIPIQLVHISNYLNTFGNMQFRHWIAIKMKNGFPRRNRLHPAHYGLLYYVKTGRKFKFHVVRAPSPVCRHCGKLLRDYGGYQKKYKTQKHNREIPLIQLADVWDDVNPQIHNKSRPKTVNELPLAIPTRAILISTNRGDTVLDIFAGGGATLHAAEINQRYWIGCDRGTAKHAKQRMLAEAGATEQTMPPPEIVRKFRGHIP